jgi:hypothetical protein
MLYKFKENYPIMLKKMWEIWRILLHMMTMMTMVAIIEDEEQTKKDN